MADRRGGSDAAACHGPRSITVRSFRMLKASQRINFNPFGDVRCWYVLYAFAQRIIEHQ